MKKVFAIILAMAMLLPILSGCGKTAESDEPGAEKTGFTTAVTSINTLNPYEMTTLNDFTVRAQIFDNLIRYRDGVETPKIAESYTVSEDGMTYTFAIRSGIKFHNGEDLTMDDIIFSFETAIASPFMSNVTYMIDSVEATDDTTFVVHLIMPYAPFMDSVNSIYIVNKAAYESGNPTYDAIGCGAYKVESYEEGQKLSLSAFEEYYGGAAPIKDVTIEVVSDPSTAVMAFESGELDFVEIPTADWDRISSDGAYGTDSVTESNVFFLAFNLFLEGSPFQDVRVRQACAYAINREDVILMAQNGLVAEAKTIGNPDYMFGATDQDCVIYEHDVEKAKALLAEAGYPNGVDIGEIICDSTTVDDVNAVIGCLAEAGITATNVVQDSTTFYDNWDNCKYNMLFAGLAFGTDYNNLSYAFTTGAVLNQFGYQNEALDQKFSDAASTNDKDTRLAIYSEINAELQENEPIVPVYFKTTYYAYNKALNYSHTTGYFEFSEYSWN